MRCVRSARPVRIWARRPLQDGAEARLLTKMRGPEGTRLPHRLTGVPGARATLFFASGCRHGLGGNGVLNTRPRAARTRRNPPPANFFQRRSLSTAPPQDGTVQFGRQRAQGHAIGQQAGQHVARARDWPVFEGRTPDRQRFVQRLLFLAGAGWLWQGLSGCELGAVGWWTNGG